MKDIKEVPENKQDEFRDNATKPFSNSEKSSAVEISNDGDNDNSRNYMGKEDESEGPNFNKKSKAVDGDSGENAGVFK